MVKWTFILNPDTDNIQADEPIGWTDADFQMIRDKKFHGVSVVFGLNEVEFKGPTAEWLQAKKKADGVDADVVLLVRALCDTYQVDTTGQMAEQIEIEQVFALNFQTYSDTCGEICSVKIGIEQKSCVQTFNNRLDQKVDMDATITSDGVTAIIPPTSRMTIPGKTILRSTDGSVVQEGMTVEMPIAVSSDYFYFLARPDYGTERVASLQTSQLTASYNYFLSEPGFDNHVSPVLLMEDEIKCLREGLHIAGRLKGRVRNINPNTPTFDIDIQFIKVQIYTEFVGDPAVFLLEQDITGPFTFHGGVEQPFDVPFDFPASVVQPGHGVYAIVQVYGKRVGLGFMRVDVQFDPETFITIDGRSKCPPTVSDVYMIHEAIDHIIQSITDKCFFLQSEYYGRVENGYPVDGCGSLRFLTSGLKIRNAINGKCFLSFKDVIESLSAIDAIGYGLELDDDGNTDIRIEPARHFYQDDVVLMLDAVDLVQEKTDPTEYTATIKVGYDKWESDAVQALDEFNSTREFRPSLKNVKGPRELMSKFIAGGYPLEMTRIQNFAATGASNSKFDNDTFIVCLNRTNCFRTSAGFTPADGTNTIMIPKSTPGFVPVVGMTFTVQGSALNDREMTITELLPDFFGGWMFRVAEPVEQEASAPDVTICVTNGDVQGMEVEQNNIQDPENMYDPETVINYRISPVRNLMRHFHLLAGIFPTLASASFPFSSGTGNFLAKGKNTADDCVIEGHAIQENEMIDASDFASPVDAMPIVRPDSITFEYPLSLQDFEKLRTNPYGVIMYRCNVNDEWKKGYLFNIKYKYSTQKASFELRKKFQ